MKKSPGSSARGSRADARGGATGRRKIDFSDIPELTGPQLSRMRRVGRPPLGDVPRRAVSIRLDETLLAWLKESAEKKGQPYQSLIHEILVRAMKRSVAAGR